MSSRTHVIDHLQKLPDVFDLKYFCLTTGLEHSSAKSMISRWAQRGYIDLAGPKSGVYFKRFGATMTPDEQRLSAVLHLYPTATLCGASVLHQHGWITQIPTAIHVAVEECPSRVQLYGVVYFERPPEWFVCMATEGGFEADLSSDAQSPFSKVRKLKPEWALEDMRCFKDGWIPDEDDLDLPTGGGSRKELANASQFFESQLENESDLPRCAGSPGVQAGDG